MDKKNQHSLPSIYDYSDYRRYLFDLTKALKAQKSHFNHSNIAKWLGLKSPGYLKMIIDGKRNLTTDLMQSLCDLLNIQNKERRYFVTLVLYNQEDHPDRKLQRFQELTAITPNRGHYEIKKSQYQYFSHPHYPCVRELVTLKDFREDYNWIAKRCFPSINVSEAKEAIEKLLELGLLSRDKDGKLVQTESFVRTDDHDTQIVEAYQAHDAMLSLAREALIKVPQPDRHYYAMTLSLPKDKAKVVIDKFYEFRDEMVKLINESPSGGNDEVYQINFQFFPRTKS